MTELEKDVDYGDADSYVNDESIEMAWAMKAGERANIHMNLIMRCNTRILKLNRMQDEILSSFRNEFPDLNVTKVTTKELKDDGMKEKWRQWCETFKDSVDDYSLGSLMRIEANKAYSEDNTIVVPKIIYLAIEMSRNVEGINEALKEEYTNHHNSLESL